MHLQEILAKHDFHLATPEQDTELQEIFEQIPMRIGDILFYTQRRPSYFSFTGMRSEKSLTFLTRDSVTKRIASVGCLSLRHGYVNGERRTVGFFGDMRSHFNRETSTKWRGFYGDLVRWGISCTELGSCKNFYTTILQPNRGAMQAYVRQTKNPFRYRPLRSCNLVNIYGRLGPSMRLERLGGWKIRNAQNQDLEKICDFLNSEHCNKSFGYCFETELPWRLKNWKGFSIEHFILIEDRGGNIVALTAPWSPGEAQQLVIESLPKKVEFLSWGGQFLPLHNWIRVPRPGEPLELLYLTHFQIARDLPVQDRSLALALLLDQAYEIYRSENWDLISFPVFEGEVAPNTLRGYLFHPIPLEAYSVHPKEEEETEKSEPKLPGIEVALI